MLVVVSPAKKLNMDIENNFKTTKPLFNKSTQQLLKFTRKLTKENLQKLMNLSSNLAQLNIDRFSRFGNQDKKASIFAFDGDTYQGLDAKTLTFDDVSWAQEHLIIISGLYGLLRPLDEIEPYRLEMGTNLNTDKGKTLYSFWGDQLSKAINMQAKKVNSNLIINCASKEYFKAIDNSFLSCKIISPIFMEHRDGKNKIISFHAKKARGMMARYIIQNRLTNLNDLKKFNLDGYSYRSNLSSEDDLVFIR